VDHSHFLGVSLPQRNIQEVVMRLFLVALLFVMSGSAVAQVPQNPEACALLRADLDGAYNRFITAGESPDVAMALTERMLEMRRKTGDPCYWPPPRLVLPPAGPSSTARPFKD
jgi:hypothetical protein